MLNIRNLGSYNQNITMDKNIRLQMAVLNLNNENIPLYEGINTIGRNKEAVVNIKNLNISQNHAIVVIMDGKHFISDLRSSNGSFYEDSKMVPFKLYELNNNAKVTLGNLSGTYVCQGPFSEETGSTRTSLVNTQSFYGCSTQLLGCSVTQSLDIHEAPTQEISWASIKPRNLNPLQTNSNIDTKENDPVLIDSIKGLSDNFNDENLPLLENNDNFTVNLDEEQTEDIEFKKLPFSDPVEDDESTDCEDDSNIKLGKLDEPNIPKDDVRKSPQNLPQFDNDSNDSIEFLKFEKSVANSGMESTSIDKLDSKAGTLDGDSENFTYKRTKKSLMVISTQDLGENSTDSTKNELEIDSSVIDNVPVGNGKKLNETDLVFDHSIPATQNQSGADLNESDFIAATQEVKQCLLDREQNKNVVSSEESFKLGLTELMPDSSQDVRDLTEEVRVNIKRDEEPVLCSNEAKSSSTSQENTDIFGAPTEKVQVNMKGDDFISLNTVEPNNTVLEPNQNEKHRESKSAPTLCSNEAKLSSTSQESTEIYDGPTQVVQMNKKGDEFISLNTIEPNNDVLEQNQNENLGECELVPVLHETTDIYDLPTQKVFIDQKDLSSDEELNETSDTYLAPTQKLYRDDILPTDENLILETKSTSSNLASKITTLGESKDSIKVDGISGIKKKNKKTFSFKKKPCDLEASLSALTDNRIFQSKKASELGTSISDSFNKLEAEKVSVNNNITEKNENTSDFIDNVKTSSDSKIKYNLEDKNILKTLNTETDLDLPESISKVQTTNISTGEKLDANKTKSEITTDASGSGLHTTNNEVNKSVAMLESKIIRTRRNKKATEIQITVPRTRRTMSISTIEEISNKSELSPGEGRDSCLTSGNRNATKRNRPSTKHSEILDSKQMKKLRSESSDNQKPISKCSLPGEGRDSRPTPANRNTTKRNRPSTKHSEILDSEQMKKPRSESPDDQKSTSKCNLPGEGRDSCLTSANRNTTKRNRASTKHSEIPDLEQMKKPRNVAEKVNKTATGNNSTRSSSGRVGNLNRPVVSNSESLKKSSRRTLKSRSINKNENMNNITQDSHIDKTNQLQTDINSSGSKNEILMKRKKLSSESDNTSIETNVTVPKKQKLMQRGLRKERPKVVFTMMESPRLESLIKQLGGSIVESVEACTVLVTERVKRSQKLLSAIGLGKPICSPKWITDSKSMQEFLDPWDYILTDPEAETKWNFCLKESLDRSRAHQLLETYSFHIQILNAADVLKGAIEACGGKCLSKIPATPLEDAYIISSPENRNKFNKILKKHPHFQVIEAEAIFDGVLRQEVRFSKHILT